MTEEKLYKIGEIAKEAGVTLRTLRYYHELGLISPTSRSSGNFRLFEVNAVAIVKLITNLKSLGFSLEEIKEMLSNPNKSNEDNLSILKRTKSILLAEKEKVKEKLIKYQKISEEIDNSLKTVENCFECRKDRETNAPCKPDCKNRSVHIKT